MAQQKLKCGGAIMKRRWSGRLARLIVAGAVILCGSALAPARADIVVRIDKSSQRMAVSVDGAMRYNWPVSTGRDGYGTPSGTFHPQSMSRHYFSRKYYNAPMPHAIFFYYGFAIHGTNDISRLGGPASHGCVRLHPSHAAALFALVERDGPRHTRIEISN
jgi:lipoprotein-anchoring transpeptidase ErfK/SrfK